MANENTGGITFNVHDNKTAAFNTGGGTLVTGDGANVQVGDGNTQNITQSITNNFGEAIDKTVEAFKENVPEEHEEEAAALSAEIVDVANDVVPMEATFKDRFLSFIKDKAPGVGKALVENALPLLKNVVSAHPLGAVLVGTIETLAGGKENEGSD